MSGKNIWVPVFTLPLLAITSVSFAAYVAIGVDRHVLPPGVINIDCSSTLYKMTTLNDCYMILVTSLLRLQLREIITFCIITVYMSSKKSEVKIIPNRH